MKRERFLALVNRIMNALARVEFENPQHLPATGAVILATNHMSRFDIPLLGIVPNRPDIRPLVADKYLENPMMRWFSEQGGAIWIDRSRADFSAFREAIAYLKQGGCLGVAPEGTRSTTGKLLEGKSGTVLIAVKTGVQVVPAAISGTDTAVKQLKKFHRPLIKVSYGEAFVLAPLSKDNREEDLQRYTDEMMCRIAVLLPQRYHGFYADHPRLKELMTKGTSG